jgi:DNA-binding transcriptional ArsR family regulator
MLSTKWAIRNELVNETVLDAVVKLQAEDPDHQIADIERETGYSRGVVMRALRALQGQGVLDFGLIPRKGPRYKVVLKAGKEAVDLDSTVIP